MKPGYPGSSVQPWDRLPAYQPRAVQDGTISFNRDPTGSAGAGTTSDTASLPPRWFAVKRRGVRPRRGFSLVEVTIASLLSSILLLMVSGVWFSFGRVTRGNLMDADFASEARFACQTFRRDFSGCAAGAQLGDKQLGRLVGRTTVGSDRLLLCYDGAPANGSAEWSAPDCVVEYRLVDGQLVRTDSAAGAAVVVADNADGFSVTNVGTGVRIELTLSQDDIEQTYTWITQDP